MLECAKFQFSSGAFEEPVTAVVFEILQYLTLQCSYQRKLVLLDSDVRSRSHGRGPVVFHDLRIDGRVQAVDERDADRPRVRCHEGRGVAGVADQPDGVKADVRLCRKKIITDDITWLTAPIYQASVG